MKKAINIWSFPPGMELRDALQLAREAGYDGIELALAAEGLVSLTSSDGEILEVKRQVENAGLAMTSLASGLGWQLPLTSDDESVRTQARDAVKRQLEVAALFEVDTILVVPGVVGTDASPADAVVDYGTAYARALEGLRELAPLAEEAGVFIGVENVWNKFLLSPVEMRDFVDQVQSPYVGVFFDVGNVVAYGYPEHWIRLLGRRIKKVHVKDYRRRAAGLAGFVDLLAGDVNWPAVIDALESIGYRDYLIAEMGGYTYHQAHLIHSTSAALDAILS